MKRERQRVSAKKAIRDAETVQAARVIFTTGSTTDLYRGASASLDTV